MSISDCGLKSIFRLNSGNGIDSSCGGLCQKAYLNSNVNFKIEVVKNNLPNIYYIKRKHLLNFSHEDDTLSLKIHYIIPFVKIKYSPSL